MQRIIQSGVRTKVLMLSATPVNNRLADLKNQIAFVTEGRDDALAGHGVASIEATVRLAQGQFNRHGSALTVERQLADVNGSLARPWPARSTPAARTPGAATSRAWATSRWSLVF